MRRAHDKSYDPYRKAKLTVTAAPGEGGGTTGGLTRVRKNTIRRSANGPVSGCARLPLDRPKPRARREPEIRSPAAGA
ncbi:hypothetical protein DF122_07130 [Burkholderia pseudomallei]|nr:hypothetical protein BOC35_12760 [Burkholderia pseudomallei]ARK71950.1 hypothetical protein BOC38_37115 [Burkholderia pseudomallei]ARL26306.1 hypothetical protein BOC47_29195 [Burkholderia pseudomallei]ARM04338.1 hypothetical protein BOC59_32245 [Burkholderia pseudomallei]QDH31852.1 hypothetical protein FKO42_32140 [Burkholderia pseudomallei]